MENNPLKLIFKINSNGDCTSQMESIQDISKFFDFLESNLNGEKHWPTFEEKSQIIMNFCNIIKKNRTIIEFFSSYKDRSLYFYLFDIFLNPNSSEELKSSVISLLNELRINLQTNKEIYTYLFNNLSLIYRGEKNEEHFYNNLILLNTILSDTANYVKPRNYFACNGEGKFIFDSENIEIGYCLTFILNFKINVNLDNKDSNICNLLKIKLDNKLIIKIDLKSPNSLMIKKKIVKILPQNEWVNLIINFIVSKDEKLTLYFFINGENQMKEEKYEGIKIRNSDEIKSIEFFDNFYGEVTSIILLSQKEEGFPGVHSDQFLLSFKLNNEGIWKRKLLDKFISNIMKLKSINRNNFPEKSLTSFKNDSNNVLISRSSTIREIDTSKKLIDDIIFIFSPFNYIDTSPNIIEDCLGKYHSFYYGNIRNHKYTCYQNKLHSVCSITNLIPIAEIFFIYPNLLTEKNLELFLKIIENILNYRKYNIQSTKDCKFFKVLCIFLEKYPNCLYTKKILDSLNNIGKTIFLNNSESLCKEYFKHILLNEKILSKYNSNLQIKFWEYIRLFCESDSSQIEKLINMNRISLLLRFYDRNKYKEICCKDHLDIFKEEYIKNKKIMNPPLNKKLSYIKEVLDVIIHSQEPRNSYYLFKLLILDLSPCLIKFIINIFKKALEGKNSDKEWKNGLIKVLIDNNYEVIIINTFIHSLPDVRIDILELMYLISINNINQNQIEYNERNQLMLKPFLLPTKIFYNMPDKMENDDNNFIKNNIKDDKKLEDNEQKEDKITKVQFIENDNNEKKEEYKQNHKNIEIDEVINNKEDKGGKEEKKFDYKNEDNNNKKKENLNINNINENIENINILDSPKKKEENNNQRNNSKDLKETKGVLIIKDELYEQYIEKLFSSFLLWSLEIPLNIPYTSIDLKKSHIKNINILQHLFDLNIKLKDDIFLQKLINSMDSIMELKENCFKALYNKNICTLLLDISFDCFIKKEKNKMYEQFYNQCKNIIIKLYTNSVSYASTKEKQIYPLKELETIYIWGDKMVMNEIDISEQNILQFFMDDILYELLTNYKNKYDSYMQFNIEDKNYNITNGYYFKNYIIFISELYHYCFHFRLDTTIHKYGLSAIMDENKKNEIKLPPLFVHYMRIDANGGKKINSSWIDYKFIDEIYHRIKHIWQKNNFYKKYEKGKEKTYNKFKKYDEIVQNLILDKNSKNIYQKDLVLLFYQLQDEKTLDIIVPVIKIIQIFMMCIISLNINKGEDMELLPWLKEFKQLLRFIIIASTNLTMKDQIDFYNKIQEYALYIITIGICFLRNCILLKNITTNAKNEIEKTLVNIITLCLFIAKFQINYFISHKKKRIFGTTKYNRNDLSHCAVVNLLNKYVLDKNEQIIFNLEFIEKILTEKHYYDQIRHLLYASNTNLEHGLFKNKKLYDLLNEKYFCFYSYKDIVDKRFNEIINLKDNYKCNYTKEILELLPLYEKELAKYSNNSLEKNLNIKNLYRNIKKQLFSWNGYWSDKSLFFDNDDNDINSKDSIINKQNENIYNENINNENNNNIINEIDNNINNDNINNEIDNNINNENINNEINNNNIEKSYENIDNINENIENKSENKNDNKNDNNKNNEVKIKKILKFKILNHYTKTFMRPLLIPILDMNYYLPNFTGFNPECLFNHKIKQIIDLDIDQILKIPENNESIKDNNIKDNEIEEGENNENSGNYLRNIYIKSNPKMAEELLKINNNLDFGKEEEEYIEEEKSSKSFHFPKIYFLSCLVKTSHHIKGVCFIDENQLNFKVFLNQQTGKNMNGINIGFTENDDDYDPERKTCFGSYFMFHHKDKNLYKISIHYSDIKWIFRRRYYYKNSALEIFTNKNKSFYFNFKIENEREIVLENILKKIKDYNKIIIDMKDTKDSFDNVIGYQNNNAILDKRKKKKEIYLSKKIDNWKKWKISNFEFIMWLNVYGNRSYNDISQYPIFPWPLANFDDPLKKVIDSNTPNINTVNNINIEQTDDYSYRDFSLPMGMLEVGELGKKRKENFIILYDELQNQFAEYLEQKPYYFGSNYSNPVYVCNFLLRIFPFTNISIELQGDRLDDPNRLFYSIKSSFDTSTTLKSDVRELIPEFFYLPEMLININNLELGKRDDGIIVNDVFTPCNNDPYKFIEVMKNVVENNRVSYNINYWIDLIFGFKAKGKEAELAKNIFSESSYQEDIDLNKIENKNTYLRMVEFGLIPNQIMTKECPKREKKEDIRKGKEITDINSKFKIYICNNDNNKEEEKLNNNINEIKNNIKKGPIVKVKIFNNEKIILFNGSNNIIVKKISYSLFDKFVYEERINNFNKSLNINKMKYYYNNKRQDKCIVFCNKGSTIILGGFYDGSFKIIDFYKKNFKSIIPFKTEEPILVIYLDEEEKYLLVGNSIGNIIIYEINFDSYDLKYIKNINDQLFEISHIDINNDLNLCLTASVNGYINIYTMPSFKLVRSKKTKADKLEYAFLSTSTLPSFIVINIKNKFREIYSYSINGHFLKYEKEEGTILSPLIINDLNMNEYLSYINKNNIIIRNLPFLNIQKNINIENISGICFSEDIKTLYALTNEEEQIYIIKDEPK